MISNTNWLWKSTLCDGLQEFDQHSEAPTYTNPLCKDIVEDYEEEEGLAIMTRENLLCQCMIDRTRK